MTPAVVSKGEFARLCQVSPTRVGQWLREGKIGPEALEGAGRFARINVEVARRQIGERTDLAQRFGNGLGTLLETPAPAAPRASADPLADSIKAEKLRGLQYANRKAAEEELERAGRYVRADQTSAAMGRMAGALINVFEGALGDFAQALAAKFQIPARDAIHLLRGELRGVRVKAAEAVRRQGASLPATLDDQVADASDPALGEA